MTVTGAPAARHERPRGRGVREDAFAASRAGGVGRVPVRETAQRRRAAVHSSGELRVPGHAPRVRAVDDAQNDRHVAVGQHVQVGARSPATPETWTLASDAISRSAASTNVRRRAPGVSRGSRLGSISAPISSRCARVITA